MTSDDVSWTDRRRVLAGSAAFVGSLLAGCGQSTKSDPIRILGTNDHSKEHHVSVTVEGPDGRTFVEEGWSLPPGSSKKTEFVPKNPKEGEIYEVSATLDDTTEKSRTFEFGAASKQGANATVERNGEFKIFALW